MRITALILMAILILVGCGNPIQEKSEAGRDAQKSQADKMVDKESNPD